MRMRRAIVCGVLATWSVSTAVAQVPGSLPNPALESRIPAPLPPPPPPPVINGPLSQGPPPGVYVPPRINSAGDRAVSCVHQGASARLRGGKLDAYTRACVNQ